MKISDISPVFYNLFYYKYLSSADNRNIRATKSQYVYRILMIDKGCLNVCVNNKTERVKAGDVIYLLPGDIYRLLPCDSDFSLYNLSFYFVDDGGRGIERTGGCVFLNNYDSALCLDRTDFEDASLLNESGTFKGISDEKRMKDLYYSNPSDKLYSFYCRATIFSLIANILNSASKSENGDAPVGRILEFIRQNPEKDLSGDMLSSLFSYHKNYINKLIKQETGKSMSDYIRQVKIEYAKALISESTSSLSELAAKLGYYDYSHFYKAFCAETGVTPKEYLSTVEA